MGFEEGMVVQELGWDSDVDEDLRNLVMDAIDDELVDEAVEAVDAVLLWWRLEDGEVADGLVDSLTDLSSTGVIWLMTPKVGRDGHIDAKDIAEAANTAGLSLTSPVDMSDHWQVQKVVRPRGARR
ncbi:DUF3052 domain-containing protein [Propionibacteriaceae bacterium G1746]|uniref:DUF3052 domain-containing protein n=1 Tax=Aestuariimicrobium sp. G57 TaxID=3418485 RepID=UPI003C2317DF